MLFFHANVFFTCREAEDKLQCGQEVSNLFISLLDLITLSGTRLLVDTCALYKSL